MFLLPLDHRELQSCLRGYFRPSGSSVSPLLLTIVPCAGFSLLVSAGVRDWTHVHTSSLQEMSVHALIPATEQLMSCYLEGR